MYDSKQDTLEHIKTVKSVIFTIVRELEKRAEAHDMSKLCPQEKAVFDKYTPKLKDITYGSREYNGFLAAMKPALDHHYARNRHHPEHYAEKFRGMNLIDLVEMFCDWKAATLRHADGNLLKSIDINQTRFGYDDDLLEIFRNSAAIFDELA